MMSKVYLEPADVWEHFTKHKDELRTLPELIAERNDYGVEVFLAETKDRPLVTVAVDGEEVEEEVLPNAAEAGEVLSELYDDYLTDEFLMRSEGYSDMERADIIDEREEELTDAAWNLLDTLLPNIGDAVDDTDAIVDGIKDDVCEYLYRRHGLSVYRPMYLECDDGTDEFCEFPYEEMEL